MIQVTFLYGLISLLSISQIIIYEVFWADIYTEKYKTNIMKTKSFLILSILGGALLFSSSCKNEDETPPPPPPPTDPGTSTSELKVAKFTAAPELDGTIDAMWATAQTLTGTTSVPNLAARDTYLNSDGEGIEEDLGLFEPYSGEENDFVLRAGYYNDRIYFLMEWVDGDDSRDRQSWYFDQDEHLWKGEHKYANDPNDKFYEDKFAFLFPIGTVDGFSSSTCYVTCHTASSIETPKDKHTRHYLTTAGQKIDMWHWKRVRGTYLGQVDDQQMVYVDPPYSSGSNGRKGDDTGEGGYSNNSQTLFNGAVDVSVPLYVLPNESNYYWISIDQVNSGEAKPITAVDVDGNLFYAGGVIEPAGDPAYAQGSGNKRLPSVITSEFTEGRGDISIAYTYTGTGWICEFSRALNTGDDDDVVFDITQELDFGLAIFDNAAIAHGIKPNLKMTYVQ